MSKLIPTILLAGVLCAPVFAQTVEIFGGAQYEHLQSSYNAVGWDASVTGNFKHVLGITGDFSGVYNSRRANTSVYTYTFGPVLTARLPVIQPFVHALFGGATTRLEGTGNNFFPILFEGSTDTAFAMFLGGGLDIGASERNRISAGPGRLAFDQVRRPNSSDRQGRVSTGLVIKF